MSADGTACEDLSGNSSLVYAILAHEDEPALNRLMIAIYNPDDLFVVHIDTKSAKYFADFAAEYTGRDNVKLISKHNCCWGGFSIVAAELSMLEEAMCETKNWSHVVFLSGNHLPLWPASRLTSWLLPGKSYMRLYEMDPSVERPTGWEANLWDRFRWTYEEVEGASMVRRDPKDAPTFRYFSGDQWVILSRVHAQYVLDEAGSPMHKWLAGTNVSDEAYFQTVLGNSKFRDDLSRDMTTLVIFEDGASSPKCFGPDEYVSFLSNPPMPFARKFTSGNWNMEDFIVVADGLRGATAKR